MLVLYSDNAIIRIKLNVISCFYHLNGIFIKFGYHWYITDNSAHRKDWISTQINDALRLSFIAHHLGKPITVSRRTLGNGKDQYLPLDTDTVKFIVLVSDHAGFIIHPTIKSDSLMRDKGLSLCFTFGNLMDPGSMVRKMFEDRRAYQVMGYLNTKPAVIYLKKILQEV